MKEKLTKNQKKMLKIFELIAQVDDLLIDKFFDLESENLLDEKIEVLTALASGKTPSEIPNYDKVLELYPKGDEMWD